MDWGYKLAQVPPLELPQEQLLILLAEAWANERREFRAIQGYGEWKMFHPGLPPSSNAEGSTPVVWLDVEALAAAGLVSIVTPRKGTATFSLTASGVQRANAFRQSDGQRPMSASASRGVLPVTEQTPPGNKVFIIHGHDTQLKQDVAYFLTRIGLDVRILHQLPSGGRTVIEKLEYYADVDYAVALLSADDVGATSRAYADAVERVPSDAPAASLAAAFSSTFKRRARQNVIYEMGLFAGKHGRDSVCAIVARGVEQPSDVAGIVYISEEGDGEDDWKTLLRRELDLRGMQYDHTKV